MNEQIKKLAEYCGLLPTTIGPSVETRHIKKKQEQLEKFALLIVEECCDQVRAIDAMDIKNHFGIKL